MEEIRNNYVEKSRYKDEDKRRAYKKNWAREKRMKVEKTGGDSRRIFSSFPERSEGQTVIIKEKTTDSPTGSPRLGESSIFLRRFL